jgi:hypothetical protein
VANSHVDTLTSIRAAPVPSGRDGVRDEYAVIRADPPDKVTSPTMSLIKAGADMAGKLASPIWPLLICATIWSASIEAQSGKSASSFVRDANRPFVYLKFDHIGTGIPRSDNEPHSRIWLQFINNCNVPILLHVSGVPDGSPAKEVGVMDDVVSDRPMLMITSDAGSEMKIEREFSDKVDSAPYVRRQQEHEMPSGYVDEVSSSITVEPGDSVLFSVPTNHVGTKEGHWHMEVPFWFATPKGHGPRDAVVGGEPVMSVCYSLYDLPDEAQALIKKVK